MVVRSIDGVRDAFGGRGNELIDLGLGRLVALDGWVGLVG